MSCVKLPLEPSSVHVLVVRHENKFAAYLSEAKNGNGICRYYSIGKTEQKAMEALIKDLYFDLHKHESSSYDLNKKARKRG